MECVLCNFHEENLQTPATLVVNGTSVCEEHAHWMMAHTGGDSRVASHNFNLEVNDLQQWLKA